MKRAFTIILVLTLMLSLTVPVFAAADGSIIITNATIGDTYRLYKIFEATFVPDGNDEDENPDAVSYTLTNSEIYNYMFGDPTKITIDEENGTRTNGLFVYVDATKLITKNENAKNADIFKYLAEMVRALDPNGDKALKVAANVQSNQVVFDNLAYGYYLIDKKAENGVDVAVTITSTTPTVNVIDKNQKPASEFGKLVWDDTYRGEDQETRVDWDGKTTTGKWVLSNSANVGDVLEFKVEFDATNYDGEKRIEYYSVMDTKGAALWVEFNKITVTVDGKVLTKGFYHGVSGTHNTGEWKWLGDGWDGTPEASRNHNDAQWYLVHYGYDKFEIVIPWLTNHVFTGTSNGFTLTYGDENEEGIEGESEENPVTSRYKSPVNVTVEYIASVEPGASIGAPEDNNLWNTATLTWNPTTSTPPDPSTTHTTVYALGMHKIDSDTDLSLAGAEFGLFRDAECKVPVYVIPTGIPGVYILDDLNTVISGSKRETSRDTYKEYLAAYLGDDYEQTKLQKNLMVTGVNGKLLILGLEAGDYYLKETVAPNGYNILREPEKVTVGKTNNTFYVILDANKQPVDTSQVAEGYTKHEYTATSVTIGNSKGVQLPSTGGEGTLMLITIGSVVAMAFAVLLITQKKMSIYND